MRKVKNFEKWYVLHILNVKINIILNSLLQNKDRNNLYKRTIRRFILAMAIIAKIHLRLSLMSQMIINKIIHMRININNQMREQYLE